MSEIADLLKIIVWPLIFVGFIFYIFLKTDRFKMVWQIFWQPLKGAQIEVYGQKISMTQDRITNIKDVINKQISSIETFTETIPYASSEIIENVVSKITVLQSFGLEPELMDNYLVLCCFGGYHYQNANFPEALKFYRLALIAFEKGTKENRLQWGGIINCLGWCYRAVKKYDFAIDAMHTSIERNSENPWPYLGLSLTYKNMNKNMPNANFEEESIKYAKMAEERFLNRVSQDRLDYVSYCGLAQLYFTLGDYASSINHINLAISVRPDSALAYYNRSIYKCTKLVVENELKSKDKVAQRHDLFLDPMSDLVIAIANNPVLRRYAATDVDFELLSEHKCFKCLVKGELLTEAAFMQAG